MSELTRLGVEFAGEIATSVWLGRLSDEAAREALGSYALACHKTQSVRSAALAKALLSEYRHRREGQDLCS